MKWLLLFGLMTGLDNVQAASGIGMLPVSVRRKLSLILAFTVSETLMVMLGLWLGDRIIGLPVWEPYAELSKALLLFLCGATVIVLSRTKHDMECILEDRPAIGVWMPLILGFDNLFAGIGLTAIITPGMTMMLAYGLTVMLLCLIGLLLGAWLRRGLQARIPDNADWISGAYLMVLAGVSLVTIK